MLRKQIAQRNEVFVIENSNGTYTVERGSQDVRHIVAEGLNFDAAIDYIRPPKYTMCVSCGSTYDTRNEGCPRCRRASGTIAGEAGSGERASSWFDKGEPVTWTSAAGGSSKEKRGTFLVRIPPHTDFRPFLPEDTPRSHIKSDMPRSEVDRALVIVPQPNGKNHYYTPRFNQLRKVVP